MNGFLSDIADNLITSFSNLHSTLGSLINSESSTLSATSKVLFNIVDALLNITGSSSDILTSLNNTLPGAFISINEVVVELQIQSLATTITGAIVDIRKSLAEAVQIVHDAVKLKFDITNKLNAAVISAATSVQTIVNNHAIIAESTTKAVGSVSQEVQEAVVALTLVLGLVLFLVENACASIACVLSSTFTSSTLNSFVLTIDSALKEIMGVISSITSTSTISVAIGVISVSLTSLASSLKSSLATLQSNFVLETTNSLESILRGVGGSLSKIGSSVANSVTSLTSSLKAVSSSSTGILSTTATQLSPVFENLSNLSESNDEIVITLISSLPNIFDAIRTASNNLIPGLGKDISKSLTEFVGFVQESLKRGLELLSGVSEKLDSKNINEFAQDIAKSIQYVGGIVVSITVTISERINDTATTNLEAVLALQIILGLVLYAVQWVLSLLASISVSILGKVSESLSILTIFTSDTLQNVSKIMATISSSLTATLSDILSAIVLSVTELGVRVTSFKNISGVVLNIDVKFEQLTSGGKVEESIKGIVNGTEGTVPDILSGLTGKLASISPELKSSISGLTNTLKENGSSDSMVLKVISSVLVLLVTQIGSVAGSTSQILSSTSSILTSVFNHLSTVLNKLSALGDVSVSLSVSVTNIQSGLYILVDAINDCSGNFSVLDEPVKNVAKTVQILISTLSAIFEAAGNASEDIVNQLFEAISSIPFIASTIVLLVQQVLGAAVVTMSVMFGKITFLLQQLTLGMSAVLKTITSIVADITTLVSPSGGNFIGIINNLLPSVAELQRITSSSLSTVSGVLANINVSLAAAPPTAEL